LKQTSLHRAIAALALAASSLLGAASGCSSGSASSECCLGFFPGSTTSYCLCGSLAANGAVCTVSTTGSTCTIDCTITGDAQTATGIPASSCAGQPVSCFNSMGVGDGTGCTDSYGGCTDGHTYDLTCTGTSCTCKLDDAVTKIGTAACGDETTFCGWNLQQ
jgi:hypothetical protein